MHVGKQRPSKMWQFGASRPFAVQVARPGFELDFCCERWGHDTLKKAIILHWALCQYLLPNQKLSLSSTNNYLGPREHVSTVSIAFAWPRLGVAEIILPQSPSSRWRKAPCQVYDRLPARGLNQVHNSKFSQTSRRISHIPLATQIL